MLHFNNKNTMHLITGCHHSQLSYLLSKCMRLTGTLKLNLSCFIKNKYYLLLTTSEHLLVKIAYMLLINLTRKFFKKLIKIKLFCF